MRGITEEDWRVLTTLLIMATAAPVVAFVLNYFLRFKWYKNAGGWNLLIFMVVVAEFLSLLLWARIGHHHIPGWFQFLMWLQFAPVAWWRLFILVDVEMRLRRKRKEAQQGYIAGQTPDGGSINVPTSGE